MSPHDSCPRRRRLPTAVIRGWRVPAQMGDQCGRRVVRIGQEVTAGVALAFGGGPPNRSASFLAHALQGARIRPAAAAASRSSTVRTPSSRYRVATVFGPTCRCSRSRMVGGKFGDQPRGGSRCRRSRRCRGSFRRQILADAGNLPQSGRVQRRQLVRMIGDDVGAVPVCADLEWVLGLDSEQVGDFPQDARDGEVINAEPFGFRSG